MKYELYSGINVDSVDILQQKLKGLKVVFSLKVIGENWVSEFEDSEGNQIEFTAPISTTL